MATLRMALTMLFNLSFICRCVLGRRSVCLVELLDYIADGSVDLTVFKNLLCRVHEEDIHSSFDLEVVFLFSPAFPNPSFQQISLDSSLE